MSAPSLDGRSCPGDAGPAPQDEEEDSSTQITETGMFAMEKWGLESRGVKLPDGRFAPAASATYRSEPRPDEHRMQWLEPTFATEAEAAEWGMKAIRAWLDARLDSGE